MRKVVHIFLLALLAVIVTFVSAYAATPDKPMLELIDKGSGVYDLVLNEDTPSLTTFQIAINGTVTEDFDVAMPSDSWMILGGAKSITADRTTWAMGTLTSGGEVFPAGKIATINASTPLEIAYDGQSHTAMEVATPQGYDKLLFGVTLDVTEKGLLSGETLQLAASLFPADASNLNVTWSSSDTDAATVDDKGLVSAIADGTAVITATTVQGGHTATCAVTVQTAEVPVTGVTISSESLALEENEVHQLTVAFEPENATNKTITWSSSNPDVAEVSAGGLVTAKSAGTATITGTTEDGGFKVTCTVTITSSGTGDDDKSQWRPIRPIKPILPTTGTPEDLTLICVKPEATLVPSGATAEERQSALESVAAEMIYTEPTDLTIDGMDYVVGTAELLAAGDTAVLSSDILGLPVVTAGLDNGAILAGGYEMEGGHLKAERPEDILLYVYKGNHQPTKFTYANSLSEIKNGTYILMDRWNRVVSGEIDPYHIYRLVYFIEDGSAYDIDGHMDGHVTALMSIYTTLLAPDTPDEPTSGDKAPHSGGGGGGCNAAGYGLAALTALLPSMYLYATKTRKKGKK